MLKRSKERAQKKGLDFNLSRADIRIPEVCPILGIRIEFSSSRRATDHSPSLDRIDPNQGYVKGNVWVISHRANMLKSNASAAELERVLQVVKNLAA
jgi:hypothetical protein